MRVPVRCGPDAPLCAADALGVQTDIKWTPGDDKPNAPFSKVPRPALCVCVVCEVRVPRPCFFCARYVCVCVCVCRVRVPCAVRACSVYGCASVTRPTCEQRARDEQARAEGRDPDAPAPEPWSLATLAASVASAVAGMYCRVRGVDVIHTQTHTDTHSHVLSG